MDFFKGIGDFFGGLFGGGRKKEDEKKPQTVVTPSASLVLPTGQNRSNNPATGGVQMPQSFVPAQANTPQIGGVTIKPAAAKTESKPAPKPQQNFSDLNIPGQPRNEMLDLTMNVPKAQPVVNKPKEPTVLENIGNFFSDAWKNTSGMVKDYTTDPFNPVRRTTNYILGIDNPLDRVTGVKYENGKEVGYEFAPENNTVQGAADKSLLNTIANELFVKPTIQAAPRLYTTFTGTKAEDLPQWIKDVNSGFGGYQNSELESNFGTPEPVTYTDPETGRTVTSYGNPDAVGGTLNTAGDILSLIPIVGGGISLGLKGINNGVGAARGLRNAAKALDEVEIPEIDTAIAGNAARSAEDDLAALRAAERRGTMPDELTVTREPNSPITTSPTTNKAPAITSPNRPDPTVQQPQPIFTKPVAQNAPEVTGVKMPEVAQPIKNIDGMTPDEATIAAQNAIDEAQTQPKPVQEQVVAAPAEAPSVTEAKVAAQQATPVNNSAVAADATQEAVNKAPTEAIAGELGKMTQNAVQSGRKMDDAAWEEVAAQVGQAARAEAEQLGTSIESILERVQKAFDARKKVKTAKQAGLSEQEFDLYERTLNELSYLRNRADPALITGGKSRWYSPRQTPDTEYDPNLVNELSRGSNGLQVKDLDLSTTPIEHAIRRYGDAKKAITDDVIDQVENMKVTENGATRSVESGVKVSDKAKAAFEKQAANYVKSADKVEKALANTKLSPKEIDELVKKADDDLDKAFSDLIDDIPSNTEEGRNAITRLQERRGAYIQSYVRTNMFSNVVNRMLDHVGSNIVRLTNQAAGVADSLQAVATGSRALSTGRVAKGIADKYAKGALGRNLRRDFNTSVALSGKGKLAKADAAFRAGGTAVTGSSDLTTTAVKMTNRMILTRAQAEGITSKAGLEKYLRQHINSPEYKELLTGVNDIYNGYLGLPTSLTSRMGTNGKWFSNVDNLVNKGLEKYAPVIPPRIRREMNDLIMPSLTGFAGATYRIGKKALNASTLGVPGVFKGLSLMKQGGEASKQIGQMMIARSMIDGLVGGAASTATVAAILSNNAEWTGAYPSDPNEAARWEREGTVPNALRFKTGTDENGNDTYLQIQPGRVLGPFSLPVVLPAVIASGGSVDEVFDGTMGQMLDNMGVDSMLQNMGNISKAITGTEYEKEQARDRLLSSAGFSISNVIPVSGLQNNIANATDPVKRDTSGNRLVDSVSNRIPGARQTLPEKTDSLGDPVRNNTVLGSQAISTAKKASTPSTDSGDANFETEMQRLADAGFETMPSKDVKNKNSTKDANAFVKTATYKNASDEKKAEMLKEALLGTKTKDINADLDEAQRGALIDYTLQDDAGRKKWLEDNQNAADYYAGDYNNKVANNTLASDDNNLENKSGARYKMIRAAVNLQVGADAALQQLYDDTSVEEYRAMIDPESEDYAPDTAARLKAYDDARTKAGVSGKSGTSKKNKFTAKSGGSGGSGSRNFSFAQLPSSLIGTGGTGSGDKYADDAPTFKPIADLQAPKEANIPKGRSISIKKGIQL